MKNHFAVMLLPVLIFFSQFAGAVESGDAPETSSSRALNIEGEYFCKGYDPFTKGKFNSTLVISKNDQVYNFKWSSGQWRTSGRGIMHRKVDNVVAVSFSNATDVNYKGLEIYKIESDGSLVGNWALNNENVIGVENCNRSQ